MVVTICSTASVSSTPARRTIPGSSARAGASSVPTRTFRVLASSSNRRIRATRTSAPAAMLFRIEAVLTGIEYNAATSRMPGRGSRSISTMKG